MMTKLIQNLSKIRQILGAAKRSLNNFKDILGTDFLIKKFLAIYLHGGMNEKNVLCSKFASS